MERSVRVCGMQFAYEDQTPLYVDFNLDISPGSLCLLVGANGSGKTTLLRILAGKHMVGGKDVVQVLNRPAFHDTQLVCSGDLAYLGGSWSKTAGCAGEIPLQGDFSAQHMIFGVEGVDPARRDKLIELLDIDLDWRMHKVSDGQRRRVQICMGLLHPFQVLLLDEVTVDLDVVARMDLLDFFKEECQQRGATIVYATHIFDGLETWATHLAYVQDGNLKRMEKLSDLKELKSSTNLLSVVEVWLRSETKTDKKKPAAVSSSSSSLSNRDHTAGIAKVITSNGQLRQYPTSNCTGGGVSMCVSQVLLADEAIINRSHEMFVCNSDSLYYDDYIPALNSDVCLEPNQMYFILPKTMLEKPLSATDMASLAVKATQALCSRSNKIKKLKVQPHDADEISTATATPSTSISQLITASSTTTIKTFSSSPSLISRKSSVRRLSRYSSGRAKSAVRSFRLTLNTIYEGVVL